MAISRRTFLKGLGLASLVPLVGKFDTYGLSPGGDIKAIITEIDGDTATCSIYESNNASKGTFQLTSDQDFSVSDHIIVLKGRVFHGKV